MDSESEEDQNTGVYKNMEGYESSIRPDFLGSANSNEESEESEESGGGSSAARDILRNGERAAAKKGLEAGLNAATGGAAGTALKAAEKAGATDAAMNAAGGLAGAGGKGAALKAGGALLVKSAPIIAVVVIVGYAIVSFGGQWLFPDGFRNRMREDNNSTVVSTTARTDAMINNVQLGNGGGTSKYGDVVFNDMQMSEDQIENFAETGITYRNNGGEKALVVGDVNSPEMIVVSDGRISAINGAQLADGDDVSSDSSSNNSQISIEEQKQQILSNLGIAANTGAVVGFSDAMNNSNFKQRYIVATKTYRGDISGWYNENQELTQKRTGVSRNNFKDFKLSSNNEENETAFLEIAKNLSAAQEESAIGDKSLKERINEVAGNSENPQCGVSSAATDIEGVINADQTARQISASSLMMEAIDKTVAGLGNEAPLTAIMNIFVRSGAADTPGIHNLFGDSRFSQSDEGVLSVSAQANIGGNGTADLSAGDEAQIRQCFYEGNVINNDGGGVIVKIGSMFKRIGGWISSAFDGIKNLLGRIIGNPMGVGVASSVLDKTADKFDQNRQQTYFSGEDTKVLGEAMRNATEKMYGEHAKGAGQTTGDAGAVKLTYRAHQEIIAEQAEFDQQTKSPFDVTSRHTFLGSIAYNLIPLATSTQASSLSSAIGTMGTMFGNAMSSLLPTSSAVSETGLQVSQGDCPKSNSIVAMSNNYCNDYYNTDLSTTDKTAVEIFDKAAEMRFDKNGYRFGTEESINYDKDGQPKNRTTDDPDYGDGPLNPDEKNYDAHWGDKGGISANGSVPHGCESDWKRADYTDAQGNVYYYYDQPIEWTYSRITNFEYVGYKSGWPNRTKTGGVGREEAKNDVDPGQCMLDLAIDEKTRQPIVNLNGALGQFMIMSGQRSSEWGDSDDSIISRLTKIDFTKGRLHPCKVGAEDLCDYYTKEWGWSDKQGDVASSPVMSRWIGGSAFTYYTKDLGNINTGFSEGEIAERFYDPTNNGQAFWEENKWYQAYVEMQEWMEAAQLINTSGSYDALARYYKENPLDNSYEGIIARYSGMSKERVIAVLDLMQYVAFLDRYDATNLYPLPVPTSEMIKYDNNEIVAQSEKVIQLSAIVYDELRNRVVTV
ncbi:hypothetical protein IJG79_01595 [Candidatus Saccharibacteria bacterium]|nr:hypothetical protein [Candidatus Saccharibacteria bacterium]